jgi:flagellar hook assembly protein FlgD
MVLPNPVISSARMLFTIPLAGRTGVSIYSSTGRLIRSWDLGDKGAGRHHIVWDRTDSQAKRVAPGVYFVEIRSRNSVSSGKVVVLR